MQRIFKCDDIQITGITPDNELNILMYGTSVSYHTQEF